MRSFTINRLAAFLGAILVLMSLSAHAAPATYALKRHSISDNRTRVTIYNAKTGRTVWTKKLTRVYSELISWTPDHKAVVFVEDRDPDANDGSSWRIFIWNAGNKVRMISHIPLSPRYLRSIVTAMRDDLLRVDSFLQVALSPDKRRLLIRLSFSQGPGSIDKGELWCLTLSTFHVQQLNPGAQGPARWLNSRTVRFDHLKMTETPNKTDASIMNMHLTKIPAVVRIR